MVSNGAPNVGGRKGGQTIAKGKLPNKYGPEAVGKILDVLYKDTGAVYRMRVVEFRSETGEHVVDSEGLSLWDGSPFADDIVLAEKLASGEATWVQSEDAPSMLKPLKRRAEQDSSASRAKAKAKTKPPSPPPPPPPPPPIQPLAFDSASIGWIVNIDYPPNPAEDEPGGRFRMRIVDFLEAEQFHRVESCGPEGLWNGDVFHDTIDLNAYHKLGWVSIVEQGPCEAESDQFDAYTTIEPTEERSEEEEEHEMGPAPKAKAKGKAAPKAKAAAAKAAAKDLYMEPSEEETSPTPDAKAKAKALPKAKAAATKAAAKAVEKHSYGNDICGHVLHLSYKGKTGKVRVVSYDAASGKHTVSDRGMVPTKGQKLVEFRETIDLNGLFDAGKASFLSNPLPPGELELDAQATTRGRGGRSQEHQHPHSGGPVVTTLKAGRPVPKSPPMKARSSPPVASHSPAKMTGAPDLGEDGSPKTFGPEAIGRFVRIKYDGEELLMRLTEYNPGSKLFTCCSHGLTESEGTDGKDTINLDEFYAEGKLTFVSEEETEEAQKVEEDHLEEPEQEPERPGDGDEVTTWLDEIRIDTRGRPQRPIRKPPPGNGAPALQATASRPPELAPAPPAAAAAGFTPSASSTSKGQPVPAKASEEESSPNTPPHAKRRKFTLEEKQEDTAKTPASPLPSPLPAYVCGPRLQGGEEDKGRIVAITKPNGERYMVRVEKFTKKSGHWVLSYPATSAKQKPFTLDLPKLFDEGKAKFADGWEDLLEHGHAVLREKVEFLVTAEESTWLKGVVVGWWPQDRLPEVVTAGKTEDSLREAIFVAEAETGGQRWQLKLCDVLNASDKLKPDKQKPRQALCEVFAGPCELTVALRRQGVLATPYDHQLCSTENFLNDDDFGTRMCREQKWDLVYFFLRRKNTGVAVEVMESQCPGEESIPVVDKMIRTINVLQLQGRGWAVETSVNLPDATEKLFLKLAEFQGAEKMIVDLGQSAAGSPRFIRVISNRIAWFTQAVLLHGNSKEKKASSPRSDKELAGRPDGSVQRRYPKSYCDAFARAVVAGAEAMDRVKQS